MPIFYPTRDGRTTYEVAVFDASQLAGFFGVLVKAGAEPKEATGLTASGATVDAVRSQLEAASVGLIAGSISSATDFVPKSTGGTFDGPVTVDATLDATGDTTVNGQLAVEPPAATTAQLRLEGEADARIVLIADTLDGVGEDDAGIEARTDGAANRWTVGSAKTGANHRGDVVTGATMNALLAATFPAAVAPIELAPDAVVRLRVGTNVTVFGDDNHLEIAGAATGNWVAIRAAASSTDADVDVRIAGKGNGTLVLNNPIFIVAPNPKATHQVRLKTANGVDFWVHGTTSSV